METLFIFLIHVSMALGSLALGLGLFILQPRKQASLTIAPKR